MEAALVEYFEKYYTNKGSWKEYLLGTNCTLPCKECKKVNHADYWTHTLPANLKGPRASVYSVTCCPDGKPKASDALCERCFNDKYNTLLLAFKK